MVGALRPFPKEGEYFWSLVRTFVEVPNPEEPWQAVQHPVDEPVVWFAAIDPSRYSVLHKGAYSAEHHALFVKDLGGLMRTIASKHNLPINMLVPLVVARSELTNIRILRSLSNNNVFTIGRCDAAGLAYDTLMPVLREQLVLRSALTGEHAYVVLMPEDKSIHYTIVPAAAIYRRREEMGAGLKALEDKIREYL